MSLIIAVPHESRPSERRVALDPSRVDRLINSGFKVRIQAECGHAASFHDDDYQGATVMGSFAEVVAGADIVVKVVCPTLEEIELLPAGVALICIVSAFQHIEEVEALRKRGVTLLAMDHLPRTTRAQPMDALSSQATVAGYKAALLAAELSPRMFPMLTTAAGTIRPSRVLVIGAGVAGLQAIATSKRLGAQVEAYDIRRAAKEQIESVGARMVDTGVEVEGTGGFARALRKDEKQKQHDVLAEHMAKAHVVICAAAIPGRRAPRIITEDMVDGMLPESVIVDMAASTGGNCEITRVGEHYYHNDTVVVGPLNLPSHGAVHASEMYSRNVFNMLELVVDEGQITLDPDDEIISSCLLLHEGKVHNKGTAKLLNVEYFSLGGVVHPSTQLPDQSSGWLNDESSEGGNANGVQNASSDDNKRPGDNVRSVSEGAANVGKVATSDGSVRSESADLSQTPSAPADDSDRSVSSPTGPGVTEASEGPVVAASNDDARSAAAQDQQSVETGDSIASPAHETTVESPNEPVVKDDLTLIEGVGPALQGRLYAFGYTRWHQLAELNEESAEKLSIQLELDNQINEQDWPGQARNLMESE